MAISQVERVEVIMKTMLNLFAISFFALVMTACGEYDEGDLPDQPDPPAEPMNQDSGSY